MIDEQGFIAGYLECALWSSSVEEEFAADRGIAPDCSLESYGFTADDIEPDSLAQIESECQSFIAANLADLESYCDRRGDVTSAESYAGHDFWLTRNGHGAGFWDRGLGALGDRLTDTSKPYGESYLYIGSDERIYVS